jgi:DNA-binding response OmpR family regulator
MGGPLHGRLVLVVEDEPLVALDVIQSLEGAGARVVSARTLATALRYAEDPDLSAAVLDHGLGDSDTSAVCTKLKERNIPFVLYSGYSKIEGDCKDGELVQKPASPDVLVATLVGVVIGQRPQLN